MKAQKVLEMLEDGKIEQLKALLQDEIYAESLKGKPNAVKRYTAMKKYFSYVKSAREVLRMPCKVEFEDKDYTSFTNSWSLVLTTEDPGEIPMFNEEFGRYPEVSKLIRYDGVQGELDLNKIIAEAKSKGYRRNIKEVNRDFKYLLSFDGTYYKVGLLDISYAIINDGKIVKTSHANSPYAPLTIWNDIGYCVIMPVRIENEDEIDERHIVIEAESLIR